MFRYRERPGYDDREPVQLYGSNQVELSWTVIPILIVVVLFLATARVIIATERHHAPKNALNVSVIGHQFWWEFRYPGTNVVTANEPAHSGQRSAARHADVPVHDLRPTRTHSFWVPRLAGKLDVIPNKINVIVVRSPAAGSVPRGSRAQYCGTQHAKMLIRVYAQQPGDFERWLKNQELPRAAECSPYRTGAAVFERKCLHELSPDPRNRSGGKVRPGPDTLRQPRHTGGRRGDQYARPRGRVDQGTEALQGRRTHAGNAP